MSTRLGFRTVDGAAGVEFTLREQAGWYALPLITLDTGGAEVWVESWRLTAEPGARPDLLSAVLTAWRPSAAAEHGASLVSRPVRIAATGVDRPVELRLRWAVGYHVTSPYTRLYNATEPLREEQVVTLRFDPPAGPAPAARPGSPARNPEPEPHLGHIAIDFGTSNCTVTLFDQNKLPVRPLSLQQATRLRDELAKLLGDRAAFGPGTEAEWEALVAELGDSVRPGTHEDPDRLRARLHAELAADDPDNPRFLYRVIVELERRIGNCSETLRPRLAVALDEACRGAWSVPSLDRLRLFPVSLDEFEGVQLESKVTPLGADGPLRVRVGKPQFGVVGGAQGETRVYAGLKQRLAQSVDFPELGAGISSDDLLREALRDLVERTNTYVATGPAELGSGRIGNVVITYPTMATPVVRHKLRDMVRALGIDRVDTSYDEAVAAAMFFLLRDFGGDHDIGLDVLRSRCREVPGHTDRWQQNLLVIDIGGGTSDIALLTLGVQDATPVMDGDPRLHGRYYELRPTLRGSTGGLQLGGELLTLRVFYWIKALLADRLWDLYPERFAAREAELLLLKLVGDGQGRVRLTEHVLHEVRQDHDGGGQGRSRSTILDVLDRIVPTRSGRGHPTQAFWLLWDLSEQIKLDFCAQEPPERLVLPDAKLHQVLRAVPDDGSGTAPYADLPGQAKFELELSAARFEELIAPDLDEVMDMARDLVVKRLGSVAGGAPERLDRVVLTGQTSRAPLVRRRLVHSFASTKDRSTAVDWRPSSIVVEHEYGKHATSIGACWAKASQSLTQRPDGAVARLKDGHNELYIDVKNLLFHLPCRFRRSTNVGGSETGRLIFDVDTELFQLDPRSDTAAARSEQFQLSKIVAVFRDGKSPMLRWGEYQWEKEDPNRDPEVMAHEMWARIEATSDLDLFIVIYRNRPHYLVEGRGARVSGVVGTAHEERFRVGRRPRLRAQDVVVNAYVLGGDHDGVQVFPDAPAEQAGPADPAGTGPFPETFHTENGIVRGIIGSPLPTPPGIGRTWTFHRRDESGNLTQIGELPVPPRDGDLPVRYRATLDEQGMLRVHAGEVPFWPADDLATVEAVPGRVLRARMPLTAQGYNTARDPFNGRH
jgi:hypothetical protein